MGSTLQRVALQLHVFVNTDCGVKYPLAMATAMSEQESDRIKKFRTERSALQIFEIATLRHRSYLFRNIANTMHVLPSTDRQMIVA